MSFRIQFFIVSTSSIMIKKLFKYLTTSSTNKIDELNETIKFKCEPNEILDSIFTKMNTASKSNIKLILAKKQIELDELHKEFITWNRSLNGNVESNFETDIEKLDKTMTFELIVRQGKVTIEVIYAESDKNFISALIHAINTFFHYFDYNPDGLHIMVCFR